ncbi:Thrombospondin type 3 repeat-containing protein [Stigmatella aurantiaca]|uniref:Thrombospondin type 3 repeat-containing protein n=1 Tax=Stigmatella aurantiaca TaxID=41 RepID=A0A1H7RYS5_STIAU|nr:OmpA family protein [Stigmatella aurantiaca]SEL65365.1 Thrombospondin type 3 repeat-containing protein [Stigmatella aurantiaca]
MTRLFPLALLLLLSACVSGSKIRADSEVIQADVERARRSGAQRCAPRELAVAEANLDFARGELSQGSSFRASEHIRLADTSIKKALVLSKDCAPKQVVVREKPDQPQQPAQPQPSQVVVRIEETDSDGDGVLDKDDPCPDQPEDRDGFEDMDGCPEPDNDKDTVLDAADKCPLIPGPADNAGCPEETPKDRDGDGIPDKQDKCPDQAEDRDGFQDEDGCPELDNDGDGIIDSADKCPNELGPLQNLGCPIVDKDGDGINDPQDKCPDEPEDKDGFQDEDGCPDLDNDADGVPDGQDKCPLEAGPAENGGCPDADKDRDGIVDRLDACPEEPGVPEEKGCAKKYKMVVVKKDRIEIKKQINFGTGSAKIIGAQSQAILKDVATVLKDMPVLKKVRIEGHTDSQGADASNLRLSQKRADAVMAQLIKLGVDPGRLEAVGYGETKPIASNATKAGRAENRRTEFNIVEQ